MKKLLSIFICGMIAGSALMSLSISYRIDELTLVNQNLYNELTKLYEEIDILTQRLNEKDKRQKLLVKGIQPIFIFPADTFTHYEEEALRLELEKKIMVLLQDLKGQEVSTIDYRLIPQIINNRHVTVLKRTLKLRVENTIIAPEITVHIKIIPVKDITGSDL